MSSNQPLFSIKGTIEFQTQKQLDQAIELLQVNGWVANGWWLDEPGPEGEPIYVLGKGLIIEIPSMIYSGLQPILPGVYEHAAVWEVYWAELGTLIGNIDRPSGTDTVDLEAWAKLAGIVRQAWHSQPEGEFRDFVATSFVESNGNSNAKFKWP